ncbi:MAG: glycosyltransferase family 39 protein [Candidatus Bathyarchaeota archaeon]|nr:glycosyltransferase family 39 protein [Candidatus Bathyarchaeota archaeon]
MERQSLGALLQRHYQLIIILTAALLITVSMGGYTNWDSQLEFEAAQNILNHGFPTVTTGLIINQPPLGFYLDAPLFLAFGADYNVGVWISAAFGVAAVALVYVLGNLLYGKRTGLVAAGLFAVLPWHAYISKIFLIDNQCLFFSLLFLAVAIIAIRQNSDRKLLAAGMLFGVAFLIKLFAVFMLVPLLLIVFFQRATFKVTLRRVLMFLAPTAILQAVWFGGFANQHFWGVYFTSDFTHPVLIADPNPLFLPRLLIEGGGWYLFLAALLALSVTVLFGRALRGRRWPDAVCLGTIATIMGLDLLLVFGFHLLVPYVSAFKYNYFTIPFFCLLAASIADKGSLMLETAEPRLRQKTLGLLTVGAGLSLVLASLVWSIQLLMAWSGFIAFEVDSNAHYFPLDVYSAPLDMGFFGVAHNVAFVLLVFGLAWPLLVWVLKKPIGWLVMVLQS